MNLRRTLSIFGLLLATPMLPSQTPAAKPAPVTSAAAQKPDKADLLDINTATPDQLKQLTGIGDAYAKRIVDGRPYVMKTQLVSHGILPQPVYAKISDSIIAKHPKK